MRLRSHFLRIERVFKTLHHLSPQAIAEFFACSEVFLARSSTVAFVLSTVSAELYAAPGEKAINLRVFPRRSLKIRARNSANPVPPLLLLPLVSAGNRRSQRAGTQPVPILCGSGEKYRGRFLRIDDAEIWTGSHCLIGWAVLNFNWLEPETSKYNGLKIFSSTFF